MLPLDTPAPTTEPRLAGAVLKFVNADALIPVPLGYDLEVEEWDESPYTDPLEFCDPNEHFHDQPRDIGSSGCSAFLVGSDLAVTAGHCIGSVGQTGGYPCTDRYVIRNFANHLTTPVNGKIFISEDDIRQCKRVIVDSHSGASTEGPLPSAFGGGGDGDYAILELFEPFDDALPLIPETYTLSVAGDRTVLLGHPSRLPMKAELTEIDAMDRVEVHALGGSSGSAVISLETGKVFSNISHHVVEKPLWEDRNGPDGLPGGGDDCIDLLFEGPGDDFYGALASSWFNFVPKLGLQLTSQSGSIIDYYGPPTNGADFAEWPTTLSVPAGSLPASISELSWEIAPTEDPLVHFDVSQRDGTLPAGGSVEVTFRPSDWLVTAQAVHDVVLPIVDYTYGTREPLLHRVHVGLDGFALWPDAAFDGEGLGVEDGAVRNYTVSNRWIVPQAMRVQADKPWIEFTEAGGPPVPGTTPIDFTLDPVDGFAAPTFLFDASVNGADMVPDVYTGEITWTSFDGGTPFVKQAHDVRFDYCRDKAIAPISEPIPFTLGPSGGEQEHTLFVPTTLGLSISDVDVVVVARSTDAPGDGRPTFGFTILGPSPLETEVILRDNNDRTAPQQDFFDDETTQGVQLLNELDGEPSRGTWTLVLKNEDAAPKAIEVYLHRLEIRAHHQGVLVCTQ